MKSFTFAQIKLFLFSTTLLWAVLNLQAGAEARMVGVPSPQCHPSVVSSMPPRIRKICEALETMMEFTNSMENYIEEKGNSPILIDFLACIS
jgi:hypothetical protein